MGHSGPNKQLLRLSSKALGENNPIITRNLHISKNAECLMLLEPKNF